MFINWQLLYVICKFLIAWLEFHKALITLYGFHSHQIAVMFTLRNFLSCKQVKSCCAWQIIWLISDTFYDQEESLTSLSGLQIMFCHKIHARSVTENDAKRMPARNEWPKLFARICSINKEDKEIVVVWMWFLAAALVLFRLSFEAPPLPWLMSALIGCCCMAPRPVADTTRCFLDIFQSFARHR